MFHVTWITFKFNRNQLGTVSAFVMISVPWSNQRAHQVIVLQKYEHTGLKQNLLRSITLDIITGLFDNATFVCIHVVAIFSKDFSEVRGLRSPGFQLQVEWMTTVLCAEL